MHSSPTIPTNLPAATSSFIGRTRETGEVKASLSTHRLVTLTGTGGAGKTRLALRVAEELLPEYAGGVWLAELAALANPALVLQAVAAACRVQEQPGQSLLDTLSDRLAALPVLVVLDNCEHLIAACAELAGALLRACPSLRLLTTSREPLNVSGEAVWTVQPLSLPPSHPWRAPAGAGVAEPAYEQAEAVQLFIARAASASSAFAPGPADLAWIADLCRRLDGLPLAIELAAARVRTLSVEEIARRLGDRFTLLTHGSRTAPPRQQTLEAALDWSYALLGEEEQRVFHRLAVFAGGFSLEAAEAVGAGGNGRGATGGTGSGERGGQQAVDVIEVLSQLVDRSLVMAERGDGETRYRLLETIRAYAGDRLRAGGDADEARDRHLAYFVGWAERGEEGLLGPDFARWLVRFEQEHDNLRAALERAQQSGRAALALRLAAATGYFWVRRGFLSEGRARIEAALNASASAGDGLTRSRALYRAGLLAYLQSDYPATRAFGEAGLALARGAGGPGQGIVAGILQMLGELATEEGDYAAAGARFTEALALFRSLGNARGIADTQLQIGWAAMRTGDYAEAGERLEESIALSRAIQEVPLQILGYSGLGELAVRRRQFEQATALLGESLALCRQHGNRWVAGTVLGTLGWAALLQRDFAGVRSALGESLAIRMELGDRGGMAWCLEKLAAALLAEVETATPARRREGLRRAVRAFAAAAALRAPVHSAIDPADQPEYERQVAVARRLLGEVAFTEAWATGEAMPLEQAVTDALTPPAPRDQAAGSGKGRAGLTRREWEVVTLIARGRSNRDIAEALSLTPKSVETYVTRILTKLGFASRVQIATWAADSGNGQGVEQG